MKQTWVVAFMLVVLVSTVSTQDAAEVGRLYTLEECQAQILINSQNLLSHSATSSQRQGPPVPSSQREQQQHHTSKLPHRIESSDFRRPTKSEPTVPVPKRAEPTVPVPTRAEPTVQVPTGADLIAAVKAQEPGLVRELIKKGVNVNYAQSVDGYFNGWTPVMFAAQDSSVPILKALIDAGADVNAKTISDGSSALHFATQRPSDLTVLPLLAAEADPTAINDYSQTPLHFAAQQEDSSSLNALLDNGFSVINATDEQGYTATHYAAQLLNPESLNFLIDTWADIELKTVHGNTPLHLAARKQLGDPGSVQPLIDVGAHLDEQDLHGNGALHYAAEQKNGAIARALLLAGASWNLKNAFGQTALHRAVEYGNTEIVNLLATSCVAVSIKDVNGFTPIYYANHRKSPALVAILESKCNTA